MASNKHVESFIRTTFRSVWALELLRFLQQHAGRNLSHAEMIAGLRGSDLVIVQSVEALSIAGLVVRDAEGGARYSPAPGDLDDLARQAIATYEKSPDAVRRLIVTSANPGAAAFADAFRLRKK